MKLGTKIAQLRTSKGLTQAELARAANCSQQTIAKIELNLVSKPGNLPNIAKALGFTVEDVLKGVEPHKSKAQPKRGRVLIAHRANRVPVSISAMYERLTPANQETFDQWARVSLDGLLAQQNAREDVERARFSKPDRRT